MKSSDLRNSLAGSQTKGLSEYQRRVSWLETSPFSIRGREAGNSQSWKARGNLGPRDSILHQTVSRLPVANKGSWDPGRLTSARSSQPEISSPEETPSTPEVVHSLSTRETEWLGLGR